MGLPKGVIGVPPLPESRGSKRKSKELRHRKLDDSDSQSSQKLSRREGTLNGMLLLCIGIGICAMSAVLSNRREVEKLSKLSKHTENLVQDLQELEMKDALTVKELANEICKSQEPSKIHANTEDSIGSFQNQVLASHIPSCRADNSDNSHFFKAVHDSESMNKIEAELEAELENLELNINATSPEQKMSTLGELSLLCFFRDALPYNCPVQAADEWKELFLSPSL